MDVGYFISELLAKHGEVSVPGLGYFARTRINGYYNQNEGKIYPPAYTVQFDPQRMEGQTLAQYIADEKNISLASSEYFIEKFVNAIKLQAQSAETAFGDLGWFYAEGAQVYFKPNNKGTNHPDFFGYQPIELQKLGSAPVKQDAAEINHLLPAEAVVPVALPPQPEETKGYRLETDAEHEAYLVELARKKRRNATIIFVVLAALFTVLIIYLVDRYDPSVFKLEAPKPKPTKTEVINARVEPLADTPVKNTAKADPKTDTGAVKQNTPLKDTLSNVTPLAVDSISYPHWEVMGGTFKTINAANTAIRNFKTLGVTAHIAPDVPGPRFHVSLGTYKSRKEATNAINTLHKDKRISKEIYPLEIKHKK